MTPKQEITRLKKAIRALRQDPDKDAVKVAIGLIKERIKRLEHVGKPYDPYLPDWKVSYRKRRMISRREVNKLLNRLWDMCLENISYSTGDLSQKFALEHLVSLTAQSSPCPQVVTLDDAPDFEVEELLIENIKRAIRAHAEKKYYRNPKDTPKGELPLYYKNGSEEVRYEKGNLVMCVNMRGNLLHQDEEPFNLEWDGDLKRKALDDLLWRNGELPYEEPRGYKYAKYSP